MTLDERRNFMQQFWPEADVWFDPLGRVGFTQRIPIRNVGKLKRLIIDDMRKFKS